jgi:hypothetical protein
LDFLEGACKLNGKRPGFVVEHHGEQARAALRLSNFTFVRRRTPAAS